MSKFFINSGNTFTTPSNVSIRNGATSSWDPVDKIHYRKNDTWNEVWPGDYPVSVQGADFIEIDIRFNEGTETGKFIWNLTQRWPNYGFNISHPNIKDSFSPFHDAATNVKIDQLFKCTRLLYPYTNTGVILITGYYPNFDDMPFWDWQSSSIWTSYDYCDNFGYVDPAELGQTTRFNGSLTYPTRYSGSKIFINVQNYLNYIDSFNNLPSDSPMQQWQPNWSLDTARTEPGFEEASGVTFDKKIWDIDHPSNLGNLIWMKIKTAYDITYSGSLNNADISITYYDGGSLTWNSDPTAGDVGLTMSNPTSSDEIYSNSSISTSKISEIDLSYNTMINFSGAFVPYQQSPDVVTAANPNGPSISNYLNSGTGVPSTNYVDNRTEGGVKYLELDRDVSYDSLEVVRSTTRFVDLDDYRRWLNDDYTKVQFTTNWSNGEYQTLGPPTKTYTDPFIPRWVGVELKYTPNFTTPKTHRLLPAIYPIGDLGYDLGLLDWELPRHKYDSINYVSVYGETAQKYSIQNATGEGTIFDYYQFETYYPYLTYPKIGENSQYLTNNGYDVPARRQYPWFVCPADMSAYNNDDVGVSPNRYNDDGDVAAIVWFDTWAMRRDNPSKDTISFNISGHWSLPGSAFSVPIIPNVTATAFSLNPTGKIAVVIGENADRDQDYPGIFFEGDKPVTYYGLFYANFQTGTTITTDATQRQYGMKDNYYLGPVDPNRIFSYTHIHQFDTGYWPMDVRTPFTPSEATPYDTNQYNPIGSKTTSVTTSRNNKQPAIGEELMTITFNFSTNTISTS